MLQSSPSVCLSLALFLTIKETRLLSSSAVTKSHEDGRSTRFSGSHGFGPHSRIRSPYPLTPYLVPSVRSYIPPFFTVLQFLPSPLPPRLFYSRTSLCADQPNSYDPHLPMSCRISTRNASRCAPACWGFGAARQKGGYCGSVANWIVIAGVENRSGGIF